MSKNKVVIAAKVTEALKRRVQKAVAAYNLAAKKLDSPTITMSQWVEAAITEACDQSESGG